MVVSSMRNAEGGRPGAGHFWAILLRLAAIAAFVVLTNVGFGQRVDLLIEQARWGALGGFLGMWGIAMTALLIAALQPRIWLRAFWALAMVLTTAAGLAFQRASGGELSILDVVSLWNARHEAARAMDFYAAEFYLLVPLIAFGFLVMVLPPAAAGAWTKRWLSRLAWAPAVPVALIAGIMFLKEGGGAQVMPTQFAPLSVGVVAGWKLATMSVPARLAVAWEPARPKARKIVLLVDESVRGDYIDWNAGNPNTPELAQLKARLVDFGPAVSGGNCSHYSNALLRFAASRNQVGPKLFANATLWQYAKKAGFRTVFIDAQAAFNRNPGKLQNFMTVKETRDIDRFHALDAATPASQLDYRLLDIMLEELKSDEPVFIYAVKNGAHFPYDRDYPEAETRFHPTMSETKADTSEARVASYRNAVRWTVDGFFKRLFEELALKDTTVIYTSDHGQSFNPRRLTHCSVDQPDPREALVPLFTISGDEPVRARFAAAASASRGHASHFSIAPTILELFGYARSDIARVHQESLLEPNLTDAAFTTGDIFGLFTSKVRWHVMDLLQRYREPAGERSADAKSQAATSAPPAEQ